MPTNVVVDPGGEHLLGFARNKLEEIKRRRALIGVDIQQAVIPMPSGETVIVRSHLAFDLIKITAPSSFPRVWVANGSARLFPFTIRTVENQHSIATIYPTMDFPSGTNRFITKYSTSGGQAVASVHATAIGEGFGFDLQALDQKRLQDANSIMNLTASMIRTRCFALVREFVRSRVAASGIAHPAGNAVLQVQSVDGRIKCIYSTVDISIEFAPSPPVLAINTLKDMLKGNNEEGTACTPEVTVPLDSLLPSGTKGYLPSDVGLGPIITITNQTKNEFSSTSGVGVCGGYTINLSNFDLQWEHSTHRISLNADGSGFQVTQLTRGSERMQHVDGLHYRQDFSQSPLVGTTTTVPEYTTYAMSLSYGAVQTIRETHTTAFTQESYDSSCGPGEHSTTGGEVTVIGRSGDPRTAIGYKDSIVYVQTAPTNGLYYKGANVFTMASLNSAWLTGSLGGAVTTKSYLSNSYSCGIPIHCPSEGAQGNDVSTFTVRDDNAEQIVPQDVDPGRPAYSIVDCDSVSGIPPIAGDLCTFFIPREDGQDEGICYTRVTEEFPAKQAAYVNAVYGGGTAEEINQARDALRTEYTVLLNNFASHEIMDYGIPGSCLVFMPS